MEATRGSTRILVTDDPAPADIPTRPRVRPRHLNPGFVWLTGMQDLRWRQRRVVMTVLGTALVFAITLLLSGFRNTIHAEVEKAVATLGAEAFVIRDGSSGPLLALSVVPEEVADLLAGDPGVHRADPVITTRQTTNEAEPADLFLVGHRDGGLGTPRIVEGHAAQRSGDLAVAESAGRALGETLTIGGLDFEVVGIAEDVTVIGGVPAMYTTIRDAQAMLLDGGLGATSVLVEGEPSRLPDGTALADLGDAQDDLFRPTAKVSKSIGLLRIMLWTVAVAVIGGVIYLSALERSRDFAVHKATGTGLGDLLGSLALQAVVMSVAAAVMAIGLAHLLAPAFPVRVTLPARELLFLPVMGVVVGLIGSLAGLRKAAQVDPALAFGGP